MIKIPCLTFGPLFRCGFLVLLLASCQQARKEQAMIPSPAKPTYGEGLPELDPDDYYDKVLGALAGSAIGDAMGASTEMWARADIRRTYGYITGLTPAVRYRSPEGTWDHNLPAGATTDDTRWKALLAEYISTNRGALSALKFAETLTNYYDSAAADLGSEAVRTNPDALDSILERIDWMKEWARVSAAYQEGPEAYAHARDRFYGGEMSCAGMLYTPVFGLVAKDPESAYKLAYDHALFDLGYAKDISALVASLTWMATHTRDMDSLLNTAVFTDPYRFQDSRLVGRISLATALSARDYIRQGRMLPPLPVGAIRDSAARLVPHGYPGTTDDWARQEHSYALLEADQEAIAFHAGEIWQILIAGLEFGRGDFMTSLRYIINYGRDNDTVAAVAGMILGAQAGYSGLPEAERELILRVSREQMGMDLEAMARAICGQPLE